MDHVDLGEDPNEDEGSMRLFGGGGRDEHAKEERQGKKRGLTRGWGGQDQGKSKEEDALTKQTKALEKGESKEDWTWKRMDNWGKPPDG